MERQFCINWSALVEEAKQRRKKQRLTQAKLAEMAGVSTPTISHFESGETNIQIYTAINIFTVLGMNDQRNLIFSGQNERYDGDRFLVLFTGKDGDKIIQCAISREALEDHFDSNGKDTLKVFKINREAIEHEARRKYLSGSIETNGSILLRTNDF